MNFRPGQPFVGTSAFAHKGGMHVHGIRKNASSYEHINPGSRRQRAPGAGERAFRQVEHRRETGRIRSRTGLRELLTKVLDRVQDLENEGYQFEAAEASFVSDGRKARRTPRAGVRATRLPRERGWPERIAFRSRKGPSRSVWESTVEHTVSEGDGPVNALDGALRKALERHFPRLKEMNLVDYKVRVINARAGTAARVRVVIESKDHEAFWGTVGVSENVIEASWLALVDAFDHKLAKDAREKSRHVVPEPAIHKGA